MNSILDIKAYEVLDSRGNPTVMVTLVMSHGSYSALAPSGASCGSEETPEHRDGDITRYRGLGVQQAVRYIEKNIRPALLHQSLMHPDDQVRFDECILHLRDANPHAPIGSNVLLPLSLAAAKAIAGFEKKELFESLSAVYCDTCSHQTKPNLPIPMLNIINGGVHANNHLDIQELMIVPHGFSCFSESIRAGVEVYHVLKDLLSQRNIITSVGDEGGFAPNFQRHEEAFECLMKAIEQAGYQAGTQISLALDVASSSFYENHHYQFEGQSYTSEQWVCVLNEWTKQYPICSIEDGMCEHDFHGWTMLTQTLGQTLHIVGDDLFVTQTQHLMKGIESHMANAVLIKPNQVGTLTQTHQTIQLAKQAHYITIASHRSGDTEDPFIADLAVASGCSYIKTGAPCRSERTAKYNRLLVIESMLNQKT